MVETIQWTEAGVVMIDQTRLPVEEKYVTCRTYEEVAEAIRGMVIRGAPAIGVAAAMGVALGVLHAGEVQLDRQMETICDTLAGTRPTAVNLFWAIERMKRLYASVRGQPIGEIRRRLVEEAQAVREEDIAINRAIGRNGAALVPDHKTVLTHCNACALATSGYGTALGVVRAATTPIRKSARWMRGFHMSGTPAASSAEGSTQASAVARSAEGRATAVHARPPAGALAACRRRIHFRNG